MDVQSEGTGLCGLCGVPLDNASALRPLSCNHVVHEACWEAASPSETLQCTPACHSQCQRRCPICYTPTDKARQRERTMKMVRNQRTRSDPLMPLLPFARWVVDLLRGTCVSDYFTRVAHYHRLAHAPARSREPDLVAVAPGALRLLLEAWQDHMQRILEMASRNGQHRQIDDLRCKDIELARRGLGFRA